MDSELLFEPTDAVTTKPSTRVLVVDDEPAVIQSVSRFLNQSGYSSCTAADGQEALGVIRQKMPDVVLLDVTMPVMDGLTVCRRLREDFRTRGLPIILLTSKTSLEDRSSGFQAGSDDYIVKPFDLEELKIRIDGALQRRRWYQWTHPLTHLPGSPGIEEDVRRRMELGKPFAFAYIDIDHFKAFNDAYGYEAGDRVIKEVADSLITLSAGSDTLRGFPGHIGGDDFVLIASIEEMNEMLPEITERFDTRRLAHYRPEDRDRGSIRCKSRRGEEQEFPLIALSVAVVSTLTRRITHYARLAEIASELKHYVKSQ